MRGTCPVLKEIIDKNNEEKNVKVKITNLPVSQFIFLFTPFLYTCFLQKFLEKDVKNLRSKRNIAGPVKKIGIMSDGYFDNSK